MRDFSDQSFVQFVAHMYSENCKERCDYGEEPYPTAFVYLQKNKKFLKEMYKQSKK